MQVSGYTDIGLRYSENQDCYCAGKVSENTFWLVLCDGMGGMSDGSFASRCVCKYMQENLGRELGKFVPDDEIGNILLECVAGANEKLIEENRTRKSKGIMGTTIVAAVVRGTQAYIAHAGDSRAYLISRRNIKLITKDHSMVQELVDAGKLTEEQAVSHPNKNVITKALGVDSSLVPDFNQQKMQKGDMLLLCSDGLSNMVPSSEIHRTALKTDFYRTAEALVKDALECGGSDNITALMLCV